MDCCRTLVLYDAPTTLRGRVVTPSLPVWAPKDALSLTSRSVDFRNLLCGRQIARVDYAAEGVAVRAAVASGSVVTLLLEDGIGGGTARIELRAVCGDGTDEAAAILLPIVSQLILTGGDTVPACETVTTNGVIGGILGPLPIYAKPHASVNIRGSIVARNFATGDTMSWDVAVTVKDFGLPGAAIGQQSVTPFQADAAMQGCAVSPVVNGPSIMFALTGVDGAAIGWSYNLNWAVA